VTLGLPSWPATLQAFALVTNPSLGLRHKHIVLIVKKERKQT